MISRKLDSASSKLLKAEEQVQLWRDREERLSDELAEAERSAGIDALESGDAEGVGENIATARRQLDVTRDTVHAAWEAREAAWPGLWSAEAEGLRREANRVEKQADKRAARTQELLAALEDHEGGPYAPKETSVLTSAGYSLPSPVFTPRTAQLRKEAAAAIEEARVLEAAARRGASADARRKAVRVARKRAEDRGIELPAWQDDFGEPYRGERAPAQEAV